MKPRNWRVRGKLTAAVAVPTLLAAALAGGTIAGSVGQAGQYARLTALAQLQRPALDLVNALQTERDLTAAYIAGQRPPHDAALVSQRASVDRAAAAYTQRADRLRSSASQQLQVRLATAAGAINGLPALRAAAQHASLTQASVFAQYTSAITALLDFDANLTTQPGGQALASQSSSLNLISLAAQYTSQARGELDGVLITGTFQVGQFPDFTGAVALQEQSVQKFLATSSTPQQALYAATVTGPAVTRTKTLEDDASDLAGAPRLGLGATEWYRVSSQKLALLQTVESAVLADLITDADHLHTAQEHAALIAAAELLVMIVIAAGLSIAVVRSLTRPLHRLRRSALDVADRHLPEAIARLRRPQPDDLSDLHAIPTGITSTDEIGELAQAFDAMQHAALRLATDQAALRTDINAMFVHLSRRSQRLMRRLLGLIDRLERDEHDPDRLASLFQLDHLATRMLRTGASLLVLAGSETGRTRVQPLPLTDALRVAAAEVEHFTRIDIPHFPDVALAGRTAMDIMHLLAELMENATVFSPPDSIVSVHCHYMPGTQDLLIKIIDRGIGMPPDAAHAANERLSRPPVLGPESVRTMGLLVVGQLAARHGIDVRLAPTAKEGLTAFVHVPAPLVVSSAVPDPTKGPEAYRPMPPAPEPVFASPADWLRHRRFIESAVAYGPPDAPQDPR